MKFFFALGYCFPSLYCFKKLCFLCFTWLVVECKGLKGTPLAVKIQVYTPLKKLYKEQKYAFVFQFPTLTLTFTLFIIFDKI